MLEERKNIFNKLCVDETKRNWVNGLRPNTTSQWMISYIQNDKKTKMWTKALGEERHNKKKTGVLFRWNYSSRAHSKRDWSSTDIKSAENREMCFFFKFFHKIFFSNLMRWYARYGCIFYKLIYWHV